MLRFASVCYLLDSINDILEFFGRQFKEVLANGLLDNVWDLNVKSNVLLHLRPGCQWRPSCWRNISTHQTKSFKNCFDLIGVIRSHVLAVYIADNSLDIRQRLVNLFKNLVSLFSKLILNDLLVACLLGNNCRVNIAVLLLVRVNLRLCALDRLHALDQRLGRGNRLFHPCGDLLVK